MSNRYESARSAVRKSKRQFAEATEDLITVTEAATIIQAVASNVQKCWYEHLGKIVSKALAAVFDDPYKFRLVFKQLANRTQVQFLLQRDMEDFDPLTSTGGGVVDVASFALRVAAILLGMKGQRQLLILDEPFRFVSEDYRPQVSALVEKLSEEFGIQIIMVTHMEELEIGKVIRVS